MKILAKRKRGNKLTSRSNSMGGQERARKMRKQIQGLGASCCASKEEKGNQGFSHEYVIFNGKEETIFSR